MKKLIVMILTFFVIVACKKENNPLNKIKEVNKNININIVDGAGTGSPMMAMFSMMQNMDIDKESDTGYERTQKFGDQNVYVKYQKSGNYEKSKLQCTLNGRFGIEANARGMTPEKLWEYIEKLEIEKLIN